MAKANLEVVNVVVGVCFKVSIIVILAILTLLACIMVHRLTGFDIPIVIEESNPIATSLTCPDNSNPLFALSYECESTISGQQCNFSNCETYSDQVSMANICICHTA